MTAEVQGLIPYYQVIKEVNIARNNLLETRQYFENMMAIPSKVYSHIIEIRCIYNLVDRLSKFGSYYQMISIFCKFTAKYEISKKCAIKPCIR